MARSAMARSARDAEGWCSPAEALAAAEHQEVLRRQRRGETDQVFTISPPLGWSTCPVMYDESAQARNT